MPEVNECQIFPAYLTYAFGQIREQLGKPEDWQPSLKRLLFHWTKVEIAAAQKANEATKDEIEGRIFELTPNSPSFWRGPKDAQAEIYPPMLSASEPSTGFTLQDLTLKGFSNTSRSVIIDLGKLALQIQPLTHTSPQLYSARDWAAIEKTPRFKWGKNTEHRMLTFHVGLALDFGEFVIAFVTHDNLFRPSWFTGEELARGEIPYGDPVNPAGKTVNVLGDFYGYMEHIRHWVYEVYPRLTNASKNTTILSFIHKEDNHLFPGIGQYSRSEVLLRAGLSGELSVKDVVENRGRLYRLLLAVWAFEHQALDDIWPNYVRAFVRRFMLAPTFDERISLAGVFLTFTKKKVSATRRFKDQVHLYNEDMGHGVPLEGRWDAVEPTFFKEALCRFPEFGPGIFSEKFWSRFGGEICTGEGTSPTSNPLVAADIASGVFSSGNDLINTKSWDTLFIDSANLRRARIDNNLYKIGSSLKLWSPLIMERWNPVAEEERDGFHFTDSIQAKNRVVVGMGEFAGNAMIIKSTQSKPSKPVYIVYPARGAIPVDDEGLPMVPFPTARTGVIQSLTRASEWNRKGGANTKLEPEERKKRDRAQAAFGVMWEDRFGASADIPTPSAELLEEDSDRDSDRGYDSAVESDTENVEDDVGAQTDATGSEPPLTDFSDYQQSEPELEEEVVMGKGKRRSDWEDEAERYGAGEGSGKRARKERGITMNQKVHPMDSSTKRSYVRRS